MTVQNFSTGLVGSFDKHTLQSLTETAISELSGDAPAAQMASDSTNTVAEAISGMGSAVGKSV